MTATIEAPPKPRTQDVHLSHSQLRCYANCSLQWQLSRRYTPEFVPAGLVFGAAFHRGLQRFYQGRMIGRVVSPGEMLAAFQMHWQSEPLPIHYGKSESAESLLEKAKGMFAAFLDAAPPGKAVAVEKVFECHLADGLPRLVGVIDLIEVRESGREKTLCITDFKTAARKPSGPEDIDGDQLLLYALAAQRLGLVSQFNLPVTLEYLIVTKAKSPQVVRIPVEPESAEVARTIEKAQACWKGMAQGLCFPNPSWMCGSCGYGSHCQQWPDLPTSA
jgi:putative RecB family exonuclease